MEDSVGRTAVEAIEVEAPVEVERDFDINELSSRDFFSLAAASLEVNVNKATPEAKVPAYEATESTIAELRAYYGDTILHYGKYSGTVEEVIDKCPAALFQVRRGFDSFVSWIDRHQIQEALEDEEGAKDEESVLEDAVESKAKDVEEKVAKKELTREPAQKIEKVIEKNDRSEIANPKDDEIAVSEQDISINVREESQTEVSMDTYKKDDKQTDQPEPKRETLSEVAVQTEPDMDVNVVIRDESAIEPEEDISEDDVVVEPEDISRDNEALVVNYESLNDEEYLIYSDEVDVLPEDDSVEEVSEAEAAYEAVDISEQFTEDPDSSIESEVAGIEKSDIDMPELEYAEDVVGDADVEANESYDRVELNEVIERFEAWRDDAKAETPIDELFIKAVEDLDATFTEVSIGADVTEEVLRSETEVSYEEFDLSSEDAIEQFDVSIEDEASPELYAMLLAVKSSRKAVEKLYTAKTKQECAEYINEIIIELSTVLRALGYDDPERIIRDFLSGHSPESLKNLIVELEKSLRHTVYRGMNARKAHGVNKRQSRVSKFINYIMQAVTSRHGVFES